MELGDLIRPEGIIPKLRANDKKQALQDLAEKAAVLTGIDARAIFEALWQRERLGSTGVGRRIAIPHARLAPLKRIVCLFARLDPALPFDSPDDEAVDLVFLLLAPEHAGADHLKALARISRLLREPSAADRLRASRDRAAIYAVLTDPSLTPTKAYPLAV
jgi:PTS system nitrogen regulatory IIA component